VTIIFWLLLALNATTMIALAITAVFVARTDAIMRELDCLRDELMR